MVKLDTVRAEDLNADGKLRRKYELQDAPDQQVGVRLAASLLIANAVLFLKTVLFGAVAADKLAATPETVDQEAGRVRIDGLPEGMENAQGDGSKRQADDENLVPDLSKIGASFSFSSSGSALRPETFPEVTIEPAAFEFVPKVGSSHRISGGELPPGNVIPFPGATAAAGGGGHSAERGSSPAGEDERQPGDDELADEEDSDSDGDEKTMAPTNRLPVVASPVLLNDIFVNQSIIIGMSEFLRHSRDPDGDELKVENVKASSGQVMQMSDGQWVFVPDAYDRSEVTFTYDVSDGAGSVAQFASLDILSLPGREIAGTEADDVISGSAGPDRIVTHGGDDVIYAREDVDIIRAGAGSDRIIAGEGDDIVYGGSGGDVVYAGLGDDVVFAGDGDDLIYGEDGNDTLFGEKGNDVIFGGRGDDRIIGGEGDDDLAGGKGQDLLDGGSGQDQLRGGDGADLLIGGSEDDVVEGGDGDDVIIATQSIDSTDDGDDHYDGGAGRDTYDLSGTDADAIINLEAGRGGSADVGDDLLENIEDVVGGHGNDVIIANEEVNILEGGGGDDTFVFMSIGSSGRGAGNRDVIIDFDVGDVLDFTAMHGDGDDETGSWQRLTFVYDAAEFGATGQLRYRYDKDDDDDVTIVEIDVEIDVDGDNRADFEIELRGIHELNDQNVWC